MSEILLFAGTTEGRQIAGHCAGAGICADVCVVTQTGADLIEARDGLRILVGALDADAMREMMERTRYRLAIDATHPYAREVTENIRAACEKTQTPYLRVKRESVPAAGPVFDTVEEMAAFLNETPPEGVVLSALGGKSLAALTAVHGFAARVWARVLPSEAVTAQAAALGYPADHIISAKGPFSVEENLAHLRQSGARYLLTKESGKTGGYPEKAEAARLCGAELLTLRRPQEDGVSAAEAIAQINVWVERKE